MKVRMASLVVGERREHPDLRIGVHAPARVEHPTDLERSACLLR